ncbi:MAG TPA: hypothetical protein VHO25_12610 [Polyangiaceae bacterium]|nr:hypothetical protein [Polyangiaceae bacterium]
MNKFKDAVAAAQATGHVLVEDPSGFASVGRYTCSRCGKAVLGNSRVAYGGATESPCGRVEERETATADRWDST